MKIFCYEVVVKDFMPKGNVLILGDLSSYIRGATEDEISELRALLAGDLPITAEKIEKYAKMCGLIVNLGNSPKL